MDIIIGEEHVFRLPPRFDIEQAREKAWDKKTSVFSSGLAGLISRPRPEEVQISYIEYRYEPFWHLTCHVHYEYERTRSYTVPVSSPVVERVTIDEKEYRVLDAPPHIIITGIEHCLEEAETAVIFDAVRDLERDWKKYLQFDKESVVDLEGFAPVGSIVVPPEVRASAVVRKVITSLLRPIQADKIRKEMLEVQIVNLYFRPVYAFEYKWEAKGKTAVVEFDGLTGEMSTSDVTLRQQFEKVMTRNLLFDVGADAVDLILPGGGIAVRVAKAVVEGRHQAASKKQI